jgi:hypothetical protein
VSRARKYRNEFLKKKRKSMENNNSEQEEIKKCNSKK